MLGCEAHPRSSKAPVAELRNMQAAPTSGAAPGAGEGMTNWIGAWSPDTESSLPFTSKARRVREADGKASPGTVGAAEAAHGLKLRLKKWVATVAPLAPARASDGSGEKEDAEPGAESGWENRRLPAPAGASSCAVIWIASLLTATGASPGTDMPSCRERAKLLTAPSTLSCSASAASGAEGAWGAGNSARQR